MLTNAAAKEVLIDKALAAAVRCQDRGQWTAAQKHLARAGRFLAEGDRP